AAGNISARGRRHRYFAGAAAVFRVAAEPSLTNHPRHPADAGNPGTAMNDDDIARVRSAVRDVPDFPKPGVLFKDITPVLADPKLFRLSVDAVVETLADRGVTRIAGIDARGFIFAAAAADRLGIGFVPIRKKGKLPWKSESVTYDLEYGSAAVEIHADAVRPGERVWLIDDVLATGGTAAAAAQLLQRLGADLAGMTFLVELSFLNAR